MKTILLMSLLVGAGAVSAQAEWSGEGFLSGRGPRYCTPGRTRHEAVYERLYNNDTGDYYNGRWIGTMYYTCAADGTHFTKRFVPRY